MRTGSRFLGVALLLLLGLSVIPTSAAGGGAGDTPSASEPRRVAGYRSPFPRHAPVLADKLSGPDRATERTSVATTPGPLCPAICMDQNFFTLQDPDGASPGDPTGAGGDNHVVVAVNVSMAVYSKTGTQEVATTTLDDLLPGVPPFFFDPKIVYDQYSDHYILVFLGVKDSTKESEIYVVSIPDATATDDATWCAREVVGDQSPGNGKQWADYPGVGYDQDRVYVSTNMFNWGPGGEGSQVIAFDKAGLYDCGDPLTSHVFTTDDLVTTKGKKIWTIQPATTVGATVAPAAYGLATLYQCPGGDCQGDQLVVTRFNGDNFQARVLSIKEVHMPTATQKGTPLSQPEAYWDPGDLRFANAFYDSDTNMLSAAHAVRMNKNHNDGWVESVVRWYEVEPASPLGDSAIVRTGNIATSKKDAGWPVVGTDTAGNLWVNYSRASGAKGAKEFLGAWMAVVPPGETKPSELVEFAEGQSLYAPFPGPERWGDFNAINRDPVDGSIMWLVNQRSATIWEFEQVVASASEV